MGHVNDSSMSSENLIPELGYANFVNETGIIKEIEHLSETFANDFEDPIQYSPDDIGHFDDESIGIPLSPNSNFIDPLVDIDSSAGVPISSSDLVDSFHINDEKIQENCLPYSINENAEDAEENISSSAISCESNPIKSSPKPTKSKKHKKKSKKKKKSSSVSVSPILSSVSKKEEFAHPVSEPVNLPPENDNMPIPKLKIKLTVPDPVASLYAPTIADKVKMGRRGQNGKVSECTLRMLMKQHENAQKRNRKLKSNKNCTSKSQVSDSVKSSDIPNSQSKKSVQISSTEESFSNVENSIPKPDSVCYDGDHNDWFNNQNFETLTDLPANFMDEHSDFYQNNVNAVHSSYVEISQVKSTFENFDDPLVTNRDAEHFRNTKIKGREQRNPTSSADSFQVLDSLDASFINKLPSTSGFVPANTFSSNVYLNIPLQNSTVSTAPDNSHVKNEISKLETVSIHNSSQAWVSETVSSGEECSVQDSNDCFESIEVSTPDLVLKLDELRSECLSPPLKSPEFLTTNGRKDNSINSKTEHVNMTASFLSQNSKRLHVKTNNLSSPIKDFNEITPLYFLPQKTVRSRDRSSSSSRSSHSVDTHYSSSAKSQHSSSLKSRSDHSRSRSRCSSPEPHRIVRYDPKTDTFCDQFGREIRADERQRYLHLKYSHSRSNRSRSRSISHSGSSSSRHRNRSRRRSSRHYRSRSRHQHESRRKHSRSRSRSSGHSYSSRSRNRCRSSSRSSKSYYDRRDEQKEYNKAIEERRVLYVGDIPHGYTTAELRARFSCFGPIEDACIRSKTNRYVEKRYGFVTFKNKSDAYDARENGNKGNLTPKFDLNFGGRRLFCNGNYTDLDAKVAESEGGWYSYQTDYYRQQSAEEDDYAAFLRAEQLRRGITENNRSFKPCAKR
ncbi:NK-tumor recognition protein-like [Stegodyphus dumicola]|uniref:NK-tumor recognition protein-like n=1 Tax=Stegodyphus dumicola TaxID=202533 RepID=UPI0015AC1AF3|nr:NK-tumor recognition protein-like [Stegodyphus dumicola]